MIYALRVFTLSKLFTAPYFFLFFFFFKETNSELGFSKFLFCFFSSGHQMKGPVHDSKCSTSEPHPSFIALEISSRAGKMAWWLRALTGVGVPVLACQSRHT